MGGETRMVKGLLAVGVLGFSAALGVAVGSRLSGETVALAVGVVLGVVAGLPMGGLVLLLQRRSEREERRVIQERRYPPVVVVNPGMPSQSRPEIPYLPPTGDSVAQRPFKIIGEEEKWE